MEKLYDRLRQQGLRITPVRRSMLQVMTEHGQPITVLELHDQLHCQGLKPHKATLYRQLETLVEHGVVQTVQLSDEVTYYEIQTHHHHHFTCTDCQSIHCITDERLEDQIHDLERKLERSGVTSCRHHFFLSGLCADCSA